ncbi:urease accessory protein UreD [Rhodospirillum sp. A1_3_36]|uniref:urease accessory protein UreD n=1 Tax=Rhodospirillum sp. A1_3_36 TaxID=3391666 RepID=UPI0039A5B7B6
MYDGTSPSEAGVSGRGMASPGGGLRDGRIGLRLRAAEGRTGGVTRLAELDQAAPLRCLFPTVSKAEPLTACLTNTAGGLVGGDRMSVAVTVDPGARVLVMAQAAEKLYRSKGPDVRLDVSLSAGEGSWLEWLPQEMIVHNRARLRRVTRLDLNPGATVLAGEMLVLGRTAHGEQLTEGLIHDAWRVRVGGRLVWADALHLEGDLAEAIAHPAGFGGAVALATLVAHAPDGAALALMEEIRERLAASPQVRAGATEVGGLLITRFLSEDGLALRAAFADIWGYSRQALGSYAPVLPRPWHV